MSLYHPLLASQSGSAASRPAGGCPPGPAMPGGSGGGPLGRSARQELAKIISCLRDGNRTILAGSITGLTRKMERAFQRGNIMIEEPRRQCYIGYQITLATGSGTTYDASWTSIGLPERPGPTEQADAFRIFKAWQASETVFLKGDLSTAQEMFARDITGPYQITLENASSAGEILHIAAMLKLLPDSFLRSEAIKTIDLKGVRTDASRLGSYNPQSGKISFFNDYSLLDKYLVTALFFHEVGYALLATIGPEELSALQGLHQRFSRGRAFIETDFLTKSRCIINPQSFFNDFIALNCMQYVILGRNGMLKRGSNQPLASELYCHYAKLLPLTDR